MIDKKSKRLRPGELDGLVLAYMRGHKKDGPLAPSAIGKEIERFPSAVAQHRVGRRLSSSVRCTVCGAFQSGADCSFRDCPTISARACGR